MVYKEPKGKSQSKVPSTSYNMISFLLFTILATSCLAVPHWNFTKSSLDKGCIGSTAGDGSPATGCVRNGCCEFDFQDGSLCEGDTVCCYRNDLCDGDILCKDSVAENGNPSVGCVDKGCCEFNYHIEDPSYCAKEGTVCCYTSNRCGGGSCDNVKLVSRSAWGGRAPTSSTFMSLPVSYAFVHHTDGSSCTTQSSCANVMRAIQNWHMDNNGWSDIGYNFLIGGDGQVYEGRGWNQVGAHTFGYNSVAVAISYIGAFSSSVPNQAQLQAGRDMLACAERDGVLTSNYRLFGHRDGTCTTCPGNALYNEIRTWDRFSFDDIPTYC